MIIDSSDVHAPSIGKHYDVCVAGGGVAGITLASALSAHLDSVQQRVRDAEIAAERADARAEQERRATRLTRILAAVVVSLVVASALAAPYLRAFLELRSREGMTRAPGLSRKWSFQPRRDVTSRAYLYRGLLGEGGDQSVGNRRNPRPPGQDGVRVEKADEGGHLGHFCVG